MVSHHVITLFLPLFHLCHVYFLLSSILTQHCEIKNEGSKKIIIKTFGEAKVLVNGEPVDDDEEEELHHLDRYLFAEFEIVIRAAGINACL